MKRFEYANIADHNLMALLTESYTIISSKKFDKKNLQILANTEHGLQGIAFNLLIGHPDHFGESGPSSVEYKIIDSIEFQKFDRAIENYLLVEKRFGATGENAASPEMEDSGIDLATILLIIELAGKVLEMIRKRRNR